MVGFAQIQEARQEIGRFVHRTPLIYSRSLSTLSGAEVFLKLENLQKTGSFKVRGAFNKIRRVKGRRVIAASMGNHAQAVACAATLLGKEARIMMPLTAPHIKQEATKGYGAEVVLHGESFAEVLELAESQQGWEFIHAFDDEEIIAGQGTVGAEVMEDLPSVSTVIVPIGGGGLIAGIATAVKTMSSGTQVIGVQTLSAPSAHDSFRAGHIVKKACAPTIADGIAIEQVGEMPFEAMRQYVDDVVLVSEASIARSVLLFLERKKLVVEGAGAVTLAALMGDRDRFEGSRVVLILSGGNIDFTLMGRIIRKGLLSSGRIGVMAVVADESARSLQSIAGIVASLRGNIVSVEYEKSAWNVPVGKARVLLTLEVRGFEHLHELAEALRRDGFEVCEVEPQGASGKRN